MAGWLFAGLFVKYPRHFSPLMMKTFGETFACIRVFLFLEIILVIFVRSSIGLTMGRHDKSTQDDTTKPNDSLSMWIIFLFPYFSNPQHIFITKMEWHSFYPREAIFPNFFIFYWDLLIRVIMSLAMTLYFFFLVCETLLWNIVTIFSVKFHNTYKCCQIIVLCLFEYIAPISVWFYVVWK